MMFLKPLPLLCGKICFHSSSRSGSFWPSCERTGFHSSCALYGLIVFCNSENDGARLTQNGWSSPSQKYSTRYACGSTSRFQAGGFIPPITVIHLFLVSPATSYV